MIVILGDCRYDRRVTRKISITLPDDVAELLDREENASAYIAEAIRLRQQREHVRDFLARHGYEVTDEGIGRMRARLADKKRRVAAKVAAGQL
jgi:Arc/MetJ-type ribon-helix-helix transcriptional regulator